MASPQPVRPSFSRNNSSQHANAHDRKPSLSSFPPQSRSVSQMSHHGPAHGSHSPQPPPAEPDRNSSLSSKGKTASTGTGFSSQHSSLSAAGVTRQYNNAIGRPRRKLRSQYPRGSTVNHVEYILVAEFDIDRGPIMEYQYPVAITGNENMLAELMLPDQTHARNQDWTIFFLHKDSSRDEDEAERQAKEERRRRRKRRLDREQGIIHESDTEDDDFDDDDWDDDESTDEDEPEASEGPPLVYVLNLVNTKHDKTAKRGAVVKAMAICTRHPFLHIYKVFPS